MYTTIYPAACLGVPSLAAGRVKPETKQSFSDSSLRLQSEESVFGCEIIHSLSDAGVRKTTRLEFRPFSIVEHYKGDVALTDFFAANSPLVSPLVVNPTREQSLQQATAEKAIFSASRQQHLFAITPSESISIAPGHRIESSGLPEERVVNALVDLNSVWEVQ